MLLVTGMATAFVTQLLTVSSEPAARGSAPTGAEPLGWLLLITLVLGAVTGPFSTRLPHRLADVAWLYAAPIDLRRVVVATIAWRSASRSAVWVTVALVLDSSAVLQGGSPNALVPALGALPTIIALTAWSAAASSTRAHPVGSRACVALGASLGLVLGVPPIVRLIGGTDPATALDWAPGATVAEALGGTLLGSHGSLSVGLVAGILIAAALLGGSAGSHLRERLTIDASFWAELSPAKLARPEGLTPKAPWRGGTSLVGPAALLWFELAALRRANFHRWAQLATLVGALVTGALEPGLIMLFPAWSSVAFVVSASMTGVALHLRLDSLLLVPGSLLARVVAVELPHLVTAWTGLALAVGAGGLVAGFGLSRVLVLVAEGAILLLVATGVRVLASALATRGDPGMPLGRFHVTLGLVSGLGVGLVLALSLLGSFLVGSEVASAVAPTLTALGLLSAGLWWFSHCTPPGRAHHLRSLATSSAPTYRSPVS